MKKVTRKTKEKYVTEAAFKKHMGSIARSFARVDEILEKHSRILDLILKELQALREDNKYIRSTLSSFVGDVTRLERQVNNLTMRVEKLELRTR